MAVSEYDKKYMSAAEQAKVEELTAAAQSGAISWAKAHNDVETIRNKYGYSGGDDGSGYSAGYGGSVYDNQYMTSQELADIAGARAGAVMGTTDWSSAHDYAENTRANYGYSGGDDGSKYIPLESGAKFSYESAPSYTNKYQSQIDELTQQILGREAFSYDTESDPLYQYYANLYQRNGERAMQNTMGQMAARTGGLASSYAGSAAQGSYNEYMQGLNDIVPELYKLAYSMYQDDADTERANLEMLTALEQGDYTKYLNLLQQYNTDRSFDYGVFSDQRNYDYQLNRDQISDSRYDNEWNYQVGRDQISDSRYEDETAYDRAQAAAKLTGSGSSVSSGAGSASSGSSSGSGSSGGIVDTMLGFGNDTRAYEYLVGLDLSTTKTDNLWALYEAARDEADSDDGSVFDGYNSSQFQAAMRTLSTTLAQGLTDSAVSGIDSFWDKLSEEQKQQVQTLLAKYGYSYEEG